MSVWVESTDALEWDTDHPFVGKLVEIDHLTSELAPNEDTKRADPSAESLDFNGQQGRCIKWDAEEEKYVVHLFSGMVVGIPEGNLSALDPPTAEGGGFDVAWPSTTTDSYGVFAQQVGDALQSKGYCVVQMFTNKKVREAALREAEDLPLFDVLRAEMEEAYLGSDNVTKVAALGMDDPEKILDDALSYCDRDLTNMGLLLGPMMPEMCGFIPYGRSSGLVRTPFVNTEEQEQMRPPPLGEDDILADAAEKFISWLMRRRLCLIYLINNDGGDLELHPKSSVDMETVKLPLEGSRMVIFRHDMMGYSYKPEGESVAIQMWLLDQPSAVEFRELPRPPGPVGLDRLHVMAAMETFPGSCMGTEQVMNMFSVGSDCEMECPYLRFDKDMYLMEGDRDAILHGKAYIMHGSFVDHEVMIGFDNEFFGMSEEEAWATAPSQRWVLETGYECLHKAGWSKTKLLGERIGFFIGDSGSEWLHIYKRPDKYFQTCDSSAVTVCRLSHIMGMTGPNISVDTACSASLVALNSGAHMMRRWTNNGPDGQPLAYYSQDVDLKYTLNCGILVMVSPMAWIGECAATMLSYRGRCFTYDSSADGFIRGEGCCSTFIQCADDFHLEETENRLAMLMGSCVNQDGRSASLTAPHGPSQQECIRGSLREAGLLPKEVVIAECHGTGTALGDPIEVGAIRGAMINKRDTPIMHASAKSHVGHEEANAGVCGFIKCVLMCNNGVCTPNPHIRALNAHLDVNGYPTLFVSELSCSGYHAMNIGVSSFGFGGTNSRADIWAGVTKGPYKHGFRTYLSPEETASWIGKVIQNQGSDNELEGFVGAQNSH